MSTVLVLDDEPTLVKLVEAILKGNDYEVHAFTRAKDALSALEGELIPDAFVCDISMPVMNGYEFCSSVRTFEKFRTTPFIFLSGLAERGDIRKGMNTGADDYLTKPFEHHELLEALEVRLRRAEEIRPPRQLGVMARGLGEASVSWDSNEVTWGSKKAAEFFFYLLEHPGGSTTWEAAEALWPEKDETRAASVFHTTLHRLRKTLEADAVQSANRRYYLNPDLEITYDVRTYLEAAKTAQETPSLEIFDAAVSMYRGPYLAGFDSEWCEDRREALHATHLGLLLDAAKIAEGRGESRRAAWYAHLAAAHEPFADTAWNDLARLWDGMGDSRRAANARARQLAWDE